MKKIAAFLVIVATLVLGATGASAAVVTVGSPLTATFGPGGFGNSPITLVNTATSEAGAHLTSPVTGRIIRWRIYQASGGPFWLRVLRPSGASFVGVGTSGPEAVPNTGLLTFPTSLPIQTGDSIGLEARGPAGSLVGFTGGGLGFASQYWLPALAEGAISPTPNNLNQIAAFNADVQPLPSIAAIAPAVGSVTGGTAVTIVGADFTNVSAVTFGGAPAASYVVDSESKITAIAPATAAPGEVDISVVALGGTSTPVATDKFKYEACTVPSLQGKKIKAVRALLKSGNCALGKVTRKGKGPRKNAKVVKQSAKAGTLLAPGSAVQVTLRSKRAHKAHH